MAWILPVTVIVSLLINLKVVTCSCFFPIEYQGTFLMQTQMGGIYGSHLSGGATFSEITFEPDAIPPWGKCHQKRGNNVILKDSTGGEDCMRCFRLTMKTPNVIQIHTEGLGKCYTKEEAAKATCPDDAGIAGRKFKEIMMYRKQDVSSEEELVPDPVFCPVSGKYRFTYSASNGEFRCDQTLSELSNCPSGNTLAVRFKQCSFPDIEVQFKCLGDWPASGDSRYLAVMDLRTKSEERSKFRCGLYRVDNLTGRMYVSLSADSTCFNQLRSATDGYESLVLTPFPRKSPPPAVRQSHCRFPEWAQGDWDGMSVQNDILTYKDHAVMQKVHINCIRRQNNTSEDRFVVFSSSHCGEETYNCIWLKRRSPNVMEFQIGAQPSLYYSDALCHDLQFSQETWTTQGRLETIQIAPCPITGDYTGVLPESSGTLCAKVASDCNNPDVMFYAVSNCLNKSQVYEEREYRCYGSWEEKNGIMYTFAKRREMEGFQCFSGKVVQNGKEAYIKEAGRSCMRGEDPSIYGMKITKHASCPDFGSPGSSLPRHPTYHDTASGHGDVFDHVVPSDPRRHGKGSSTEKPDVWPKKPPPSGPSVDEEKQQSAAEFIASSKFLVIFLVGSYYVFLQTTALV